MSAVNPAQAARIDPVGSASVKGDNSASPYFLIALAVLVAWQIATGVDYQAGAGIGYAFGLVGGSTMLVLLLYPLAKRIAWMRSLLALKHWFRGHMLLGVIGPVLILLHSRLSFGSINGEVAFWAMTVVFASGVFGRYVYTKIHHGLYGRHLGLNEVKTRLGINEDNMRSKFHFHPPLEQYLVALEQSLLASSGGGLGMIVIGPRVRWAYFRASRELKTALAAQAGARGWDRAKVRRSYRYGKKIIATYLGAIKDAALFKAYERIFSAWHLLHIPLMVILVVTGVIHVIAVHMY